MSKQHEIRNYILGEITVGNIPAGAEIKPGDTLEGFRARCEWQDSPHASEVGRGAYRGAIEELASLRVVETSSGSTTRVRRARPEEFEKEAIARLSIETVLIEELALHTTGRRSRLAKLTDLHEAMVVRARRDTTLEQTIEFVFLDWKFHQELCQASGVTCVEPVVSSVFWTFVVGVQEQWSDTGRALQVKQDVCREHMFVLHCMHNGDAENAAAAMRYHLIAALDRVWTARNEKRPTDRVMKEFCDRIAKIARAPFDGEEYKQRLAKIQIEPRYDDKQKEVNVYDRLDELTSGRTW